MQRRSLILGGGSWWLASLLAPAAAFAEGPLAEIAVIERRIGGRIGLAVLDTRSGAHLGYRASERFAMCSTFKWLLAAALLGEVDARRARLDERLAYGRGDLLEHSPVTAPRVAEGGLALGTLCEAAVVDSDNTAANLLLERLGGPLALTRYLRRLGDPVTRLDRREPALNDNLPGDPRDTTTPAAMAAVMRALLTREVLAAPSRERLLGWLRACRTGRMRLRAGLPPGWQAGDKTGTGARGAVNDVAIVWPPHQPPFLLAVYLSGSTAAPAVLDAVHARLATLVTVALGLAEAPVLARAGAAPGDRVDEAGSAGTLAAPGEGGPAGRTAA